MPNQDENVLVTLKQTEQGKVILSLPARIDSSNAAIVEEELLKIAQVHTKFTMDLENVEYIASAGIRTLVKLMKKGVKFSMINASEFVYDTLDMVGIEGLIRVYKKLREVSVDGLEQIGKGSTAILYRLDEDKIIKVYHSMVSEEMALQEKEVAKKLFLSGVPTAVPYEVVTSGGKISVIYEGLYSGTLNDMLIDEPENAKEIMTQMANLRKEMKGISLPDEITPMKHQFMGILQFWVKGGLITAEELPKYLSFIKAIPDVDDYLHGDFHPGNIMKSGEELMLIDLPSAGTGHVIFDLAGCCSYLKRMPMFLSEEEYKAFSGLDRAFALECWQHFLNAFFSDKDAAFIDKAERQILTLTMIRAVTGKILTPHLISDEAVEKAMAYIEENGPLLLEGPAF